MTKDDACPASSAMDTRMFIFYACANAHIHCCLSIKWVDQGVVYPIRLSGYPAWLRNKGVRIIEVLLYMYTCNVNDWPGKAPKSVETSKH